MDNSAIRITRPPKPAPAKPRRFDPDRQPGRQYVPRSHLGPYWGVGLRWAYDGVPPFLPIRDIPRMQVDDAVSMSIGMRIALVLQAECDVECSDESAKAWIEDTLKVAWTRLVPTMMLQYFCWGYSCALPSYIQDPDNPGFVNLVGGRMVTPTQGVPHVWTEGPYTGQFYGIDLGSPSQYGAGGGGVMGPPVGGYLPQTSSSQWTGNPVPDGDALVPAPWAMWFGGMEAECPLYDRSPLAAPYIPWLEKCMRGGATDTRRTFFRRAAIPPMLWRVPLGRLDPDDPNSPTCMEWAAYLAANLQNNDTLIVPDARAPGIENSRTEPQWSMTPAGALNQGVDVLGYVRDLDRRIMQAFQLPPETVESGDSGGGYGGRQIPQQALYAFTDQLAQRMYDAVNANILRETVPHNFGERCRWRLKYVPMVEAIRRMEQQGAAGGGPEAIDPALLEAASGGGGEADGRHGHGAADEGARTEASNLVPYVGTRGGVGKKNVVTGRISYEPLSGAAVQTAGNRGIHNLSVGPRLGCLLVKCPDGFAAAVRKLGASIPKEDLAADGVEEDTHVTVRYGLRTPNGAPVFGVIGGEEPTAVTAGRLACFEAPGHDVLYVPCEGDHRLGEWNRLIDDSMLDMAEPTHPEYIPHVTVAYLRPGLGKKYVGKKGVAGQKWVADRLEYHRPDGKVEGVDLWPATASLKLALLGEEAA